ncbi:ParA family protein [Brevibacillus borstelensis]|uniref:ParA family protein n=1 Tax=Brevibacillus borstelensis TaxID=45462 RepID=UPI0030C2F040
MAYALSNEEKKVLLVDFDPQGNLTLCFGIEQPYKLDISMFNIMNAIMNSRSGSRQLQNYFSLIPAPANERAFVGKLLFPDSAE